MNSSVPLFSIALGAALLLFGRKLFWLFVAALGFAVGVAMTSYVMHQPPPWLALVLGLFLGLAGALIAFVLQKIAVAGAGFLAGGRLAVLLASAFVVAQAQAYWIVFVIGGIIGAVLLLMIFDWALIILSSAEGAHLIATAVRLPERGAGILFIALLALGIVAQGALRRRR